MKSQKLSYERTQLEKEYEALGMKFFVNMPPKMKLYFEYKQSKIVSRIKEITEYIKSNPIEVIDTIHYVK